MPNTVLLLSVEHCNKGDREGYSAFFYFLVRYQNSFDTLNFGHTKAEIS